MWDFTSIIDKYGLGNLANCHAGLHLYKQINMVWGILQAVMWDFTSIIR